MISFNHLSEERIYEQSLDTCLHPVGFGERLEHESNTSQSFVRVTKHRIAHTTLKYGVASCGEEYTPGNDRVGFN